MILDAERVSKIMEEAFNDETKFEKIAKDPRADIKKDIKKLVSEFGKRNLLSAEEVFVISGLTKNGGMSRVHEFVVGKTYMYSLSSSYTSYLKKTS